MSGQHPYQPGDADYSIFSPAHGTPLHGSPETGLFLVVAPSVLDFLQKRDIQKTERERITADLKIELEAINANKQIVLDTIHGQIDVL